MRALVFLGLISCGARANETAHLAFARGVLEEARGGSGRESFEAALAADPGAWPLVARVARLRWQAGEIEGASTLWREFALAHPERLAAQLAYADFLREAAPRDDFAAKLAGEVLENARRHHPAEPAVVERLFRTYEQRGLREKSQALFEEAAAEPALALTAATMARTLFSGDDAEAARRIGEILDRALELRPADPVLARAASEHFREAKNLSQAIAILERHAAAAPGSLDLRVRLGVLQLAAERRDAGERTLLDVLAIDARHALAHQALAKLYRRLEKPEPARHHAAELLKIRGGSAEEFAVLAEEMLAAGDARAARLLLEKGAYDHPDDAELAARLAVATRRDPAADTDAARLFRAAESLLPPDEADAAFLREFAECLWENGESAAAEQRLREAIKRFPPEAKQDTAAALRRLAGIWQAEGRNAAAARALLQRADALDPETAE